MTRYIQGPSRGKAEMLLQMGAREIAPPDSLPADDTCLVCVVRNTYFEAAALVDNVDDLEGFKQPDPRPKMWLSIPLAVLFESGTAREFGADPKDRLEPFG